MRDVVEEELVNILRDYVAYEQALYDDLPNQGAPQPSAPHFSFARFYNWINELEQP